MTKICSRSSMMRGHYALAAYIVTAAPSRGREVVSASFVHHVRPHSQSGHLARTLHNNPMPPSLIMKLHQSNVLLLQGTKQDETIDPSDVYTDSTHLPSPPSSLWGVADDWSSLSSVNVAASTPDSFTSSSPSMMNGNFDAMEEAARILEEQENILSEWDSADAGDDSAKNYDYVKSSGDDFVENAVEIISSNADYNEPGGVQLYDTVSSVSSPTKDRRPDEIKQDDQNREDGEMAFMIRCNQSPEQFLISQGRALPELTDEMKYSANFLLEEQESIDDESNSEGGPLLPLQSKATPFFKEAIKNIFDTYSVQEEVHTTNNSNDGTSPINKKMDNQNSPTPSKRSTKSQISVLDRKALSGWMTQCIFESPLTSPQKPANSGVSSKKYIIGPYDQGVSAVLSRYSQSHGSGRLTLDEFQALYLEVAWSGYIRDIIKRKTVVGLHTKIPSAHAGVLIKGRKNTEKMLKQASLSLIWRDLEAHEIFSPAEEERVKLLLEMERLRATAAATEAAGKHSQLLMDECELFEEYEDRLSHQTYSDENENDVMGAEYAWDFLKGKKEKGSHEMVEMAFDGKTPKRIRDGQFVFIDEESCIGCSQCAQIAPSTFKMIEESGRARAFYQRNSIDVESAVMACPVNCMHLMSFDELKEMETSRDDGDGRTDHRHFGGGRTQTPLFVSGIDSDANHKSSWYHYLKWKCHGSASCPQRGCYDCPTYAPGENPFFKERHKQAEHVRARDFMESGEADKWRKVVEL